MAPKEEPVDSSVLAQTDGLHWAGLPFLLLRATSAGVPVQAHFQDFTLHVVLRGKCRTEIMTGSRAEHRAFSPSSISLYQPGEQVHDISFTGQIELVRLVLADGCTGAEPSLVDPQRLCDKLHTIHHASDEALSSIARAMACEVTLGCPSGRLFSEALSLALVARLESLCSEARARDAVGERSIGELSAGNVRRIVEYIEEHLSDDLSLPTLSQLSRQSVSSFSSAFRKTLGRSPYQYVIERRIHRSTRLLGQQQMTLAEIALDCGFSSQSRYTEAFNRFMGETPARYRRRLRGQR